MFDEITEKETIFLFIYTSPLNKSKEKKLSFCNYILSIEVLIEGGFINDTIAIVLSKFVTKKNGVLIFLNLYCENGFFFYIMGPRILQSYDPRIPGVTVGFIYGTCSICILFPVGNNWLVPSL